MFKRVIGSIAVVLTTAFLTAGCIKVDMDLTVAKDDTVSGTIIFAIAKSLAEATEGGVYTGPNTEGLLPGAANAKTEPYEEGDFVGTRYTFSGVPLENFRPEFEGDTSELGIVRDGDNLVVSGVLDTSTPDQDLEDNPFGAAIMESFAATTSIKISITLPGEIKETNGDVTEQTITWSGALGKKLEMQAVAYAPLTPPIDWILLAIIAGGILFIVVGVLIFVRMRNGKYPKTATKKVTVNKSKDSGQSAQKLTFAEAMEIRPWYQKKRYAIPLIAMILTALVFWVSITN